MDNLQADNTVKNLQNLPISNPRPDLQNINAHTKFGENPLKFIKLSSRNEIWTCPQQIILSKIAEICPLAIQNQISTTSIHTPSLVKIH